jgi:hypothetical protein
MPPSGSPALVADWLGRASGADVDPAAALLTYVRYLPGESCLLGWSFPDASGRAERVTALACAGAPCTQAALESSRASRALEVARRFSASPEQYIAHVADYQLLLQRFPLDLALPVLPAAFDEGWLQRHVVPALHGSSIAIAAHVVHYNPMRRCVVRYDTGNGSRPRAFFGKFYRGKRGAALYGANEGISTHLAAVNAPWRVPAPRAYLEHLRVLFFDAVPEARRPRQLFRSAAEHRGELLAIATRAIVGLAEFRNSPVRDVPQRAPLDEIASLRGLLQSMRATDSTAAIAQLINRLLDTADSLPPEAVVLTHGRFRLEQFLDTSGQLFLIDLDTVCLAGASADPGSFVAHLDLAALRLPRAALVLQECAAVAENAAIDSGLATREWLAWHRARIHVQKAVRAHLGLHAGADRIARSLIDLADRTISP